MLEHPRRHGLRLGLLISEGESRDSLLDSFRRSGGDITTIDVLFPSPSPPATQIEMLDAYARFRAWVRGILDEIAAEHEDEDDQ